MHGQSLDRAGICLPKLVFSHGHLYMGCLRCGDPGNVFIYADQSEFYHIITEGKYYTRNVVYPEILSDQLD